MPHLLAPLGRADPQPAVSETILSYDDSDTNNIATQTGDCTRATSLNRKANTYRLYPTPGQAQQMAQIAGACRFVYNLALEQRRDWYRPGRQFNFVSQCREVTMLRNEVDWLRACPVRALQQALKDLDRAYKNWWSGRTKAPTPRKKGVNDSFRFSESLKVERTGASTGRIKLPKLGWIGFRGWYSIPGAVCNTTVSCRTGQWHVAVQWELETEIPIESRLPSVGIDMGIAVFAALSDGTNIAPVDQGKKSLKALREGPARPEPKTARFVQSEKGGSPCRQDTSAGGERPQGLPPHGRVCRTCCRSRMPDLRTACDGDCSMSELSIYDKRRDCVERWHLGDPAAAVDMATEIARLRIIEEHAGYVRDTIETLSVGHTTNAETLRRALRLVVKAYDENVS